MLLEGSRPGLFICIEGGDGSGKNTQSGMLEEHFAEEGREVLRLSFPDYSSEYGAMIREHLDGKKTRTDGELFALFYADQKAKTGIMSDALERGAVIIVDRYLFSTIAYQSGGELSYEDLKGLETVLGLPKPDVVFFIDVSPLVSMERKMAQRRAENCESDRHESSFVMQQRVYELYKRMAGENLLAGGWHIIDGTKSPHDIYIEIVGRLPMQTHATTRLKK